MSAPWPVEWARCECGSTVTARPGSDYDWSCDSESCVHHGAWESAGDQEQPAWVRDAPRPPPARVTYCEAVDEVALQIEDEMYTCREPAGHEGSHRLEIDGVVRVWGRNSDGT